MSESDDAPKTSKTINYITLGASLIFASVGAYLGMNREDNKALVEAVSAVRERVARVEARLDGLERREPR